MIKNYCQHRIKLIAGFSLFTKVLADFLSVINWLTLVLKHATNLIQQRCHSLRNSLEKENLNLEKGDF